MSKKIAIFMVAMIIQVSSYASDFGSTNIPEVQDYQFMCVIRQKGEFLTDCGRTFVLAPHQTLKVVMPKASEPQFCFQFTIFSVKNGLVTDGALQTVTACQNGVQTTIWTNNKTSNASVIVKISAQKPSDNFMNYPLVGKFSFPKNNASI